MKYSRHRVGADAGSVLVGLAIDDANQRHPSVLDRNSNRSARIHGVFIQRWVAVNCSISTDSNAVVHRREWINLDVIHDILNTFRIRRHSSGRTGIDGSVSVAAKRHNAVTDIHADRIEWCGSISDTVIFDRFGELRAQFLVRNWHTRNLDVILNRLDAL